MSSSTFNSDNNNFTEPKDLILDWCYQHDASSTIAYLKKNRVTGKEYIHVTTYPDNKNAPATDSILRGLHDHAEQYDPTCKQKSFFSHVQILSLWDSQKKSQPGYLPLASDNAILGALHKSYPSSNNGSSRSSDLRSSEDSHKSDPTVIFGIKKSSKNSDFIITKLPRAAFEIIKFKMENLDKSKKITQKKSDSNQDNNGHNDSPKRQKKS